MKKIIPILFICMFLYGCSSNNCKCDDAIKDNTLYLEKYKNTKIKISGLYNKTLTKTDLKNIKARKMTFNLNDPFYSRKTTIVGYSLLEVFKNMGIKHNFNYFNVINNDTSIRYSYDNLNYTFLIFYEDGIELDNPKFVRLTTSDVYWINDVTEFNFTVSY